MLDFSDHTEVTDTRPTCDVVRERWLAQDIVDASAQAIRPPEGRLHQHLGQEGGVPGTSGPRAQLVQSSSLK